MVHTQSDMANTKKKTTFTQYIFVLSRLALDACYIKLYMYSVYYSKTEMHVRADSESVS